ncbi:MAG: fumarate hydratase [Spirochaetaceae bacterium]|jgi:fumarate hydratase subunit alpha|nr:fumarate hydratase [Spirochaetaceae bacterium]GMO26539.1 MAG: fumarate hydratase [Termitinemataceae bacterium]
MRIINAAAVTQAVRELCVKANRELPSDVKTALRAARETEKWPLAKETLDKIISNFERASEKMLPICQDTGIICVFVELGQSLKIEGGLEQAINEGVRQGFRDGFLRASIVRDPLRRENTGDNTPAMIDIKIVSGSNLSITIAPKGFGSENCGRIAMLNPAAGLDGITDFVIGVVKEAGANPCPPVVVGVGIGGSFDKAALLAKKALLRPLDTRNSDPFYRDIEDTLLKKINALGIGPQGYGGGTTALSVAIEVMPAHIAGLPCAVNINCHAARRAGIVL